MIGFLLRLLLKVSPVEKGETFLPVLESPLIDKDKLREILKRAFIEISENNNELLKNLIHGGISEFESTKIIAFLPEACQRVVIENFSFLGNDRYILLCLNTKRKAEAYLSEDQIFVECIKMVRENFDSADNQERVNKIASMSATNQSINIALKNGSKIENFYFAPMMVVFNQIPAELLEKS